MKIKALSESVRRRLYSLKTTRGQSLVEMAFILPILLLITAGIVEVGHTLNTYLTVANATREGTRYGVTVGASADDDQTITDQIVEAMEHKGMEVTDENTCIWVVRLETDGDGNITTWDDRHVYGHDCLLPDDLDEDLESELGRNTRALVAWTYYEQKSMLGIPFLSTIGESIPIAPHTAMRMVVSGDVPSRTGGCCVYPIAVHRESLEGKESGDLVLNIRNGAGQGQFAWLSWKGYASEMCSDESGNTSTGILADSLAYPGNSCTCDTIDDDEECWRGYLNPDDTDRDYECYDPEDDQEINVGDYVWGSTGNMAAEAVRGELDEHKELGRTLRIIIWDEAEEEEGGGSNIRYRVYGFALVQLLDYHSGEKTISAIFLGWDTSCGQPTE